MVGTCLSECYTNYYESYLYITAAGQQSATFLAPGSGGRLMGVFDEAHVHQALPVSQERYLPFLDSRWRQSIYPLNVIVQTDRHCHFHKVS